MDVTTKVTLTSLAHRGDAAEVGIPGHTASDCVDDATESDADCSHSTHGPAVHTCDAEDTEHTRGGVDRAEEAGA
jgi:hypothetical protein